MATGMVRQERAGTAARQEQEQIRAALAAAGMGTWEWHIETGLVTWTAQTYRLFGLQPDAFVASYQAFLDRVHPEDREMVAGKIASAVRECGRNVMEFRILRADGSARRMRCSGAAIPDATGRAARLTGVIADITEDEETVPAPLAVVPLAPLQARALATRQVAQLLGVGEATVKRLTDSGALAFARSSSAGKRRFSPEHVLEHLRRHGAAQGSFASLARSGDLSGSLAALVEAVVEGKAIEALLDDDVAPAAQASDKGLLREAIARLPALAPEKKQRSGVALLARVEGGEPLQALLTGCLLRWYGYEVLTPADGIAPAQLPVLAERMGARFVAVVAGPRSDPGALAQATAQIASRLRGGSVCVRCDEPLPLPAVVTAVRSMRDLARLLQGV